MTTHSTRPRGPIATICGLALLATVAASCASAPEIQPTQDGAFAQAVEASLERDSALASAASWSYIKASNPDDPRYDRALRLLARGLERQGYTYAASLWYLEIARARRDVTLVTDALTQLSRLMRQVPYDQDTIVAGYLASAEISGLSDDVLAFVSYYQGLDSLRRGLLGWANTQFSRIPAEHPYALKARYALIIRQIALGSIDPAKQALEDLAQARNLPKALAFDIDRTLARIAFEKRQWRPAQEAFQNLRELAPNDPELLLEMAWTHYYLGEYQRALGLLLALDAPAYNDLIAPERYLLEALSLRRLCQFEPARRAAVRLERRHGNALSDLYAGVPLKDSVAIKSAARLRQQGKAVGQWRLRLEREAEMVQEHKDTLGPELTQELTRLYARGLQESERRENDQLADDMREVAEDLLGAQEGVNLILHELGVALLRGRKRGDGAKASQAVTTIDEATSIAYNFDGEFWTDELDDIVVKVEDRCID